MTSIKIVFALVMIISGHLMAYSSGYTYEKREKDKHIIHILTMDPNVYKPSIVKANDSAIGRETVSSIAKRSGAEIAINGGFFEIGANKDGMPSGTLIIQGNEYGMKNHTQPLLIINSGVISIIQANPKDFISHNVSMVSGIPLLISNGKIAQGLSLKNDGFYTKSHARTAIGVKSNNRIVIVVAEHNYQRDLFALTMGEVQSLMKEKGKIFAQKYHKSPGDITLNELKEILKEEFSTPNGTQGLTIVKLAELMQELECQNAINLDGGGSSTMWIENKIVNQTIGDIDEGEGSYIERPVSDAIVFKKNR